MKTFQTVVVANVDNQPVLLKTNLKNLERVGCLQIIAPPTLVKELTISS